MQNVLRIVNRGDRRMFMFVNHRLNCRILNIIMPIFTALGGGAFTVVISLSLMLLAQNGLKLAAARGSIALAAGFAFGFILKKLLGRDRPYLAVPGALTGDKVWHDYSFPSGHTTASFSLALTYGLTYPVLLIGLMSIAMLVGLSRIYLGQHYPTDVLAGAVIGSIAAVFSIAI